MVASQPASRSTAAFFTMVVAVIASVSFARIAQAADTSADMKMPASYAAMMKMKPMALMHMMDKDKKGYVTKEDFMKFHEAMFEKMDKNKDGKITKEEWTSQAAHSDSP
jgi:hypothetical protein